jgi:ankyrin repeat protein
MCAAKGGQTPVIRLLVEAGAGLIRRDLGGQTAAHFAAQEDQSECLDMLATLCEERLAALQQEAAAEADKLISLGISVKKVEEEIDKDDGEGGNVDEVPTVEETIDSASKNGTRPLHVAAAFNSLRAVESLIRHGAEVCIVYINIY